MDENKIREAVRLLLEGIGEDPDREGLRETPDRIARMYGEIFAGMSEDAAGHLSRVFTVDSREMVLERDIVFYSMCEHHMLPFFGKVHVAYIPDGRVTGLSKLARTVEVFARRLQIQDDGSDRRRGDGEPGASGSYDSGGGRAYVHDHARDQKARQQHGERGCQRSFRGG